MRDIFVVQWSYQENIGEPIVETPLVGIRHDRDHLIVVQILYVSIGHIDKNRRTEQHADDMQDTGSRHWQWRRLVVQSHKQRSP